MTNRLAEATSPYLLQHRDNPVHWQEWGEEAFAEARRRNVPVLLSVGYAACHWCQVSARSSALSTAVHTPSKGLLREVSFRSRRAATSARDRADRAFSGPGLQAANAGPCGFIVAEP